MSHPVYLLTSSNVLKSLKSKHPAVLFVLLAFNTAKDSSILLQSE